MIFIVYKLMFKSWTKICKKKYTVQEKNKKIKQKSKKRYLQLVKTA